QVETAADGLAAINLLRASKPDLVVLDLMMPKLSGVDVLKFIRSQADLKTLPTDKPVVVYCYTGQTSAFMAAYLRLLGYDAKSLLFGGNGMIYDNMAAAGLTTWKPDQIMGYDYVTSK
ncbi:MAG TPA: response regulator, partial [Bacteroidales bacterium]|nr:response regulator [Bacteroidales bacterium]